MNMSTSPTIGRTCHCCSLPIDMRRIVLARILHGHAWVDIAEYAGCSNVAVTNHARYIQARSSEEDFEWVRDWSARNILPAHKALEKAQQATVKQVDQTPDVTTEDINRRLLVLERYGYNLLQRVEQEGSSIRDSTGLMEAIRRLCMSLADVNGLRRKEPADVVESVDVERTRNEILALIEAGAKPSMPKQWSPDPPNNGR